MAYIEKRTAGDGTVTYRAKVHRAGQPKKSATFDKRRDAVAWANQVEADMLSGKLGAQVIASKYTVADMINRYIRQTLSRKTDNKPTIKKQRGQLQWWSNRLKDCLLVNLTPYIINDCRNELAGEGDTKRSPYTVNGYIAVLNHVINTAIKEWGWMSANPIAKISKTKEPRGRARFLTEAECSALLAACKRETRKPLYLIVLFALSTGARKGEILTLRRKDVDIMRGVAVAYDTKNGDNRQLYLSQPLCGMVAEHMARRTTTSRLLFASRNGNIINIESEWRRALKRAGIDNFRFHDLRHTSASYMAMNGANPSVIAEALGHKSLDMVKRYSHLSTTHVGNEVRAMNAKVFQPMIEGARV